LTPLTLGARGRKSEKSHNISVLGGKRGLQSLLFKETPREEKEKKKKKMLNRGREGNQGSLKKQCRLLQMNSSGMGGQG